MGETTANTLTAFFADAEDIRHDLEFVILDSGPIHPGTRIVASHPESMQLGYLGTLGNIAGEKSSTIVFPIPVEVLNLVRGKPQRT